MKLDSVYRGDPDASPLDSVTVDGRKLSPRFDLRKHSPDGFAWGYGGSGPAQLALALMADFLGDDRDAQSVYQSFKDEVIVDLPQYGPWEITGRQMADSDAVRHLLSSKVMED